MYLIGIVSIVAVVLLILAWIGRMIYYSNLRNQVERYGPFIYGTETDASLSLSNKEAKKAYKSTRFDSSDSEAA